MQSRNLRVQVEPIPAQFASCDLLGRGEILNLSKRGIFVRTDRLPEPGAKVHVTFKDAEGQTLDLTGEVRWTTDQLPKSRARSSGFGVLFTEWNGSYHDFMERLAPKDA